MPNSQQSTRLFQSNFWECFTHVHHKTPFFIFIPALVSCLFYAASIGKLSALALAGYFAFGTLHWTLFEYLLHRYFFHYEATSGFGKTMIYLLHGVHHDYPQEADRLVMPPVTSIPIAITLFGIYFALLGFPGAAMFSGFMAGYLYYEHVHYSAHNAKRKFGWTDAQRKNHLRHHFQDAEHRFGVTSPLWDFVFRTYK